MIDGLRRDIKHGLQLVLRQPGTALVVATVLGLGIGVNATVFTVTNALLFRDPAGVREPDRLVRIHVREEDGSHGVLSYPQYAYLRERAPVFSELAAYSNGALVMVRRSGTAEQAVATFVTGNFFPMLGVRPGSGRWVQPSDDVEGAAPVVVLGHGYWQRALGGDASAIGSTIAIYGKPFTIVGVAPPEFRAFALDDSPPDLWLPVWARPSVLGRLRADLIRTPGHVHTFLTGVGRLAAGQSIDRAQAVVDAVGKRFSAAFPNEEDDVRLTTAPHVSIDPDRRTAVAAMLRVLSGVAFIVLAIACANLANLMLVRASSRAREVGVRLSLGATRWVLLRQFLSETLVLSVLGGGLGLLFSSWFAAPLARQLPLATRSQAADLASQTDWRVLGFAAAIALLSAVGFGLAPAFHASRTQLADVLRSGTRVVQGSSRTRTGLLVGQIALTLVLLIGSALLVRSVQRLRAVPIGYRTDNTLFASFNLRPHGYHPRAATALYGALLERVRTMPGVAAAALTDNSALSGGRSSGTIGIEGQITPEGQAPEIAQSRVSTDFFRTLGLPIRAGRDFTAADRDGSDPVVIVNEAFARRFWPGQSALGKRINNNGWWTVVGVVADARLYSIFERAEPTMFQPVSQNPTVWIDLQVRTAGDPGQVIPLIRREMAALDANVNATDFQTLDFRYRLSQRRFTTNATLVSLLGALALILAVVGLYATVSHSVLQRTHEIGVRMAVGARRADVLRLVFRSSTLLTMAGVMIGSVLALVATRAIQHWLFGISPVEPVSYLIAISILVGAVLLASWLPARRALRVDPLVALRQE
ncbi:MAG: ABC transporter permease [Longimicrobiales bacterium]